MSRRVWFVWIRGVEHPGTCCSIRHPLSLDGGWVRADDWEVWRFFVSVKEVLLASAESSAKNLRV